MVEHDDFHGFTKELLNERYVYIYFGVISRPSYKQLIGFITSNKARKNRGLLVLATIGGVPCYRSSTLKVC